MQNKTQDEVVLLKIVRDRFRKTTEEPRVAEPNPVHSPSSSEIFEGLDEKLKNCKEQLKNLLQQEGELIQAQEQIIKSNRDNYYVSGPYKRLVHSQINTSQQQPSNKNRAPTQNDAYFKARHQVQSTAPAFLQQKPKLNLEANKMGATNSKYIPSETKLENKTSYNKQVPPSANTSTELKVKVEVIDLTKDDKIVKNSFPPLNNNITVSSIAIPVQEPYISEDGTEYVSASTQTNTLEMISIFVQTECSNSEEKHCQTEIEEQVSVVNAECQTSTRTENKECQTDKEKTPEKTTAINNNHFPRFVLIPRNRIMSNVHSNAVNNLSIINQPSHNSAISVTSRSTLTFPVTIRHGTPVTRSQLSNEIPAQLNQIEKTVPNVNTPTTSTMSESAPSTSIFVKSESKRRRSVKEEKVNTRQHIVLKKYFVDMKNKDIIYKCMLCDAVLKGVCIVKHYVHKHPEEEVLISRLEPTAAQEAIANVDDQPARRPFPSFICLFCNLDFQTKKSFKDHVTTHTGEYRYECCFCKFKAHSTTNIEIHMRRHADDAEDDAEDDGRLDLKAKKLYHISGEEAFRIPGYICTECNFVQISIENVKQHITKHHYVSIQDSGNLIREINFIKLSKKSELHKQKPPSVNNSNSTVSSCNKTSRGGLEQNNSVLHKSRRPLALNTGSVSTASTTKRIFEQDTQEAAPSQKKQCTEDLRTTIQSDAANNQLPVIVDVYSLPQQIPQEQSEFVCVRIEDKNSEAE